MFARRSLLGEGSAIDSWPKLEGLERLLSVCTDAFSVLPYIAFEVSAWTAAPQRVLDDIHAARLGRIVVVRSCAALEDAAANESPGFFESVLNVDQTDRTALAHAIERVCKSYWRRPGGDFPAHKVLVQTQLLSPVVSGVCRVGPADVDFLEVDYDDTLARTDAVTAGLRAKRLYLSPCQEALPPHWRALRKAMDVVRQHYAAPFFVEFSLDHEGTPVIFQIRSDRRPRAPPLARSPTCAQLALAAEVATRAGPLSVMADWNPAELLGRDPQPLDLSLYDELLMSGAWAEGRSALGWRKPVSRQLMVEIGGRPYIRLALSLESLLPAGLSPRLANDIVKDRLRLIAGDPQLHDKVEFRVMWSAFAFNEAAVRTDLATRGFGRVDVDRLLNALKRVTRKALRDAPTHLQADRAGMAKLRRARQCLAGIVEDSAPRRAAAELRRALTTCRIHGAVPFSRQARIAFSFRYILNHLIESDSIVASDVRDWEAGLNSVVRSLSRDLVKLTAGAMSRAAFNRRYGHLRPNTYNLEARRYDERPTVEMVAAVETSRRTRRPADSVGLAAVLKGVKAGITQEEFWLRAGEAFRAREEVKFEFTALLSDILLVLGRVADWSGLDRKELRSIRIEDLLARIAASDSWPSFGQSVKASRVEALPVCWPLADVIFATEDLHAVKAVAPKPTFIGADAAEAPTHLVTAESEFGADLRNAIVAIAAPDPGFDWIFAQPLAGLVTAYGGEFSHMGVRCAEFRIPAALGCGTALFDLAVDAERILLDAGSGEIWSDGRRLFPQ